ncbi:MAG: hypothetical protein ABI947_02625 [Chloroflexota bacterium]
MGENWIIEERGMYGKWLPRKKRDAHFDVLFDYKGRAEHVRKVKYALDNIFVVGMSMVHAKDSLTARTKLLKVWRTAIANAYPPGFWEDFEQLRNRNSTGLPIAIEFLEADPWFFRTGYVKEKLIRYILRLDLSASDAARLRKVVIAAVDQRYRREFRDYCRLARKVDAPELRQALHERLTHENTDIRRRAQWMWDGLEKGVHRSGFMREWRIERNRLVFSSGFLEGIEKVHLGDTKSLNWAISLLTEDGHFGVFGYDSRIRGKLIDALADVDVPAEFKPPLQKLILSTVDTWYVYAFNRYCKLASRIDTPEFRREVKARLDNPDFHIRRRASLVLEALK